VATFHCGLCGRVSKESACGCHMGPRELDCSNMPGNNCCRGTFALGSACKQCERCMKEAIELLLAATLANGGQIVISPEVFDLCRANRLVMHTNPVGETCLTAMVKKAEKVQCDFCDGLGGYGITGSTAPAQVCRKCNGTGKVRSK